jgi:dihydroorotate dehydrogenase (NAD+) catalytic subunit
MGLALTLMKLRYKMLKESFLIRDIEFKNRIFTASGTFGYGDECSPFFNVGNLGAIVTKSISIKPRLGNNPNRIYETYGGMLNSIGLANVGVDVFITEKLPVIKKFGTNIIVNIVGNAVEEYQEVTEKLEDIEGISGYEVNISCPNVKQGGLQFGTNLKMTEQIVNAVRKLTKRVLIIKLTPNVTRVSDFASVAESEGADAVSLINTLVGMAININTRKPFLSTITGGLSGPAIKPVAIAKVYEVYNKVKIPIVGIGGIIDYKDVIEFFLAGASAVEIGTANFINPASCDSIINDLRRYCEESKISDICSLIGGMQAYS